MLKISAFYKDKQKSCIPKHVAWIVLSLPTGAVISRNSPSIFGTALNNLQLLQTILGTVLETNLKMNVILAISILISSQALAEATIMAMETAMATVMAVIALATATVWQQSWLW